LIHLPYDRVFFGNGFYKSLVDGKFEEISDKAGLETFWPWGIAAGDFDNDGFVDAYVPSGMGFPWDYWPNRLLMNQGDGTFRERSREEGIEPLTLASYLAKIGTSDAIEPRTSLDALAADFGFDKIARAPAHFDVTELTALNGKLLHQLPFEAVSERLAAFGITGGAPFWEAVRPNLVKLSDALEWWKVVNGVVAPVLESPELTRKAGELLPPEPWDETTWGAFTKRLSDATGARGRALFHPLRLALTGRGDGPEMKKLLPIIGRAKSLARLKGETA